MVPIDGWNTTNNQAEYRGLIAGMQAARRHGIKRLQIKGDSELVINQMNGYYQVRSNKMWTLHSQAQGLCAEFHRVEFKHVSRAANSEADALANDAIENY